MREEIFMLKMNGYCCSQMVMKLGLDRLGMENPQLIDAMAGLCDGAKCGSICGAASAASCLMYLADAKAAEEGLAADYMDWFEESFGSLECRQLVGDDPGAKMEKCPMLVENTMYKLEELLEWD